MFLKRQIYTSLTLFSSAKYLSPTFSKKQWWTLFIHNFISTGQHQEAYISAIARILSHRCWWLCAMCFRCIEIPNAGKQKHNFDLVTRQESSENPNSEIILKSICNSPSKVVCKLQVGEVKLELFANLEK